MKVLTAHGEVPVLRNAPADPFVLFSESIDDLLLEANNFLDGSDIENEEQEKAVASILTRLRREANGADEARKVEKKPHDEAAKAVQEKWTPLLKKADLAVETAKTVLARFLQKKEDAQRAAVEAARLEAERQAAAARKAAEDASPGDLAGQTTARVLQEAAEDAAKRAGKLEKQKVQAKGGERAVSLRTTWVPTITDRREVLKHYIANRPDELEAWLLDQVQKDCRVGKRNVPGVHYDEKKGAA